MLTEKLETWVRHELICPVRSLCRQEEMGPTTQVEDGSQIEQLPLHYHRKAEEVEEDADKI